MERSEAKEIIGKLIKKCANYSCDNCMFKNIIHTEYDECPFIGAPVDWKLNAD